MSAERSASRATAADLVRRCLHSPESSWSNGISGAIGEFMYDEEEAVSFDETADSLSACTQRGAISVRLPEELTCFAYEQLTQCTRSWTQEVALALPRAQARMPANRVITELGTDREAIRSGERKQLLFDLGLGSEHIRFCVRTGEKPLARTLRSLCGRSLPDQGPALLPLLRRSSPARVIISALGRIEVYTPIPDPGAGVEIGPHTHLLPALLGKDESVIPDDYSGAFRIHPPHPLHDKYGVAKPFDRRRYRAFQQLLEKVGIEDYLREKAAAENMTRPEAGGASIWYDIARRVVKIQSPYLCGQD